jgi:hypothetical protein
MELKQIILNNEYRRFVIVTDVNNVGIKLDDDNVDDGFVVLNDEEDLITNKAFDAVLFILENGTQETSLQYAIYSGDGDSLNVQSLNNKVFDTGSAQVYAQGLPTDTPEVKSKKLQSILDLTDFKRMCVEIINR